MKPALRPPSDPRFGLGFFFQTGTGSVLFGFVRLLLVSALLWCCAGETADNSVQKVLVSTGESVILPCNITVSGDIPTVEWSKEGLAPNITFLYRAGCETFEEKNAAYKYRTSLIMDELKNGNISLRISSVQPSDAGKHQCVIGQGRKRQVIATLELIVCDASEPKLSVVPGEGDGVTLQCEASGWSQVPEITFLDDQGNRLSADDPRRDQDPRGCFTVTRRVTVKTATRRVKCRIHQPQINQCSSAEIYIPAECMRSFTVTCAFAVLGTLIFLLILVLCVCGVLHKKYGYRVRREKLEVPKNSTVQLTRSSAEVQYQRHQADNTENTTSEHLRLIEQLRAEISVKDKNICQLTKELNNLRSKQSSVVGPQSQPTTDSSPTKSSPDISNPVNLPLQRVPSGIGSSANPAASTDSFPKNTDSKPVVSSENPALGPPLRKSHNNHSSPDLLTNSGAAPSSAPSASATDEKHLVRSMSLSASRTHPNAAKLQRRYTTSAVVQNRFSVLADLPEDSEPLL